nr:sulfatase-like hydrolase/transferase [Novipirellula artificiosorum]
MALSSWRNGRSQFAFVRRTFLSDATFDGLGSPSDGKNLARLRPTGLVGKWHIGRGKGFHPLARGFDEFQGFDGSRVLSYFDYTLDVQGETLPVKDKYLTDDLTERAIDFVRRHQSHPFFLHSESTWDQVSGLRGRYSSSPLCPLECNTRSQFQRSSCSLRWCLVGTYGVE